MRGGGWAWWLAQVTAVARSSSRTAPASSRSASSRTALAAHRPDSPESTPRYECAARPLSHLVPQASNVLTRNAMSVKKVFVLIFMRHKINEPIQKIAG
eukprot:3981097-Pleurochrysis_carterae.AAC.2